jgi:hypothetical protein
LPRFAGGCGGCRKALGRRHARCSVAHSELCGETGGPSSADDGRGLSLHARFCQVQIKKRCLILLKPLFRTAHGQINLDTRVTRVEVTVRRRKVSARRRPKSNPGRLAVAPPDERRVGFARVTLSGDQSQTVHCVRAVTEDIGFAQLVEGVERPVTVLVDETVERAADARAAPLRGMLPSRTHASRGRGVDRAAAGRRIGGDRGASQPGRCITRTRWRCRARVSRCS